MAISLSIILRDFQNSAGTRYSYSYNGGPIGFRLVPISTALNDPERP